MLVQVFGEKISQVVAIPIKKAASGVVLEKRLALNSIYCCRVGNMPNHNVCSLGIKQR